MKRSHCWWHLEGTIGALWEAALAAGWKDAEEPGGWTKVVRTFRDGHREVAEVVRLYGLRMWVEQSYKQVKHRLGFSQYQARSDVAIRRHWQLVFCAFSFC